MARCRATAADFRRCFRDLLSWEQIAKRFGYANGHSALQTAKSRGIFPPRRWRDARRRAFLEQAGRSSRAALRKATSLELYDAQQAGLTYREIAARFGYTDGRDGRGAAYATLKKAGLWKRRR